MAGKNIRVSKRMLFTWFMLGGLILLFAPQKLTNSFQFSFARIFKFPLKLGHIISLSTQVQTDNEDFVSRQEYERLNNHLANLNQQLQEANYRIEQLSGWRNLKPLENAKFVLADVVKALDNELVINCQKEQGVSTGQFVLCNNSVIGVISEVSDSIARIKLISNPTAKFEVKIADESAVLTGKGNGFCEIRYIPTTKKIKVGQKVFVKKVPGFLNGEFLLGSVISCKIDDDNPLFWNIKVEPACTLKEITDVAVVVMNGKNK